MTFNIHGIDSNKGLDLYDGDEEVFIAVLRSYVSNTPEILEKLYDVSAETLADYASAIHGVKGTSAIIGAEDTRKTAEELEMMAKAGNLDGVLARNDAFIKSTNILIDNINIWLKKQAVGGMPCF